MKLALVATLLTILAAVESQRVEFWISQPRNNVWLQRQADLTFVTSTGGSSSYTIDVNEANRYQQMDGFGGSMTDASCWLFKYRLSASKRAEVLGNLFGSNGINLSLLRQPIGASDFGWEAWSLDDTTNNADDFALNNFYLWREDDYIRPMLDLALAVSPGRIKLFASPWSPPAWMKTNKHLNGNIGGALRSDCYDVYGDYFVKYIKEYANRGSPIYAITIQNEPLYAPSYPGMLMTANEQINFIRYSLGPKLRANGLNTKIVVYDHNWDDVGVAFVDTVLNEPSATQYIAGVGYHPYTSQINHAAMSQVHSRYNKEVWLTEAGSGTWIGDAAAQFQDQMMHLLRVPRNWGKGVIFWNIALDQNSSPKLAGVDSSASNRGFVTIRSDQNDAVTYETSYYSMGHSSKFVNPGAYRIDSTSWINDLETIAYLNGDNTIALVISNRGSSRRDVKVTWKSYQVTFSVEATSAATLKWSIF